MHLKTSKNFAPYLGTGEVMETRKWRRIYDRDCEIFIFLWHL